MTQIRLTDRNVLITGGTRGIGRAIALDCARAGATVVACYGSDAEAAERLARDLKETGGDHHVLRADVGDDAGVDRILAECTDRVGSLDTLVHCAGHVSHVPVEELTRAEWQRTLNVNLTAAYLLVRGALPMFRPGASVILVGSGSALVGLPQRAHYTAAKAGLIGLTRSLAKELGPAGIRVNLLAPGVVQTEAPLSDALADRYRAMIPLGRLAEPGEISAAALFLASDMAPYVNGTTLGVDGGI